MMALPQIIVRNQTQRIPESNNISENSLTATTDIGGGIFEAEANLFQIPIGKKSRIKGVFTVELFPTNSVLHEISVDDGIDDIPIYRWVPSGNQNIFSPLVLDDSVGITADFILNAGDILKHRYQSTVSGRSSTLLLNILNLELPV